MLADIQKENLQEYAQRYSWNLMTQMKEYLECPIIIERGEGCWLYDIHGNKYLDGNASMWTNTHGHNHSELNSVLINQLSKLADTTYVSRSHEPGLCLAHKLAMIAPQGLSRTFFTNNGSTAIETALKLSFQYWQLNGRPEKINVISLAEGHHGLSFGATAVSNHPQMHGRFKPWCFPCDYFKSPECLEYGGKVFYENDTVSLQNLEELLQANSKKTACLVMEASIQSVAGNGMKLQPRSFLKKVERLCNDYEIHLILDEVFVGFGRTGTLFASKTAGVTPDFLCLGKSISAGYLPLGATLTKENIYQAFLGEFEEGKTFIHGHTYGGNALATAVALKNIQLLEERINSGSLDTSIKDFAAITKKHFEDHTFIKELRQRGFMCAIDLYPGKNNHPFLPQERIAYKVSQYALTKGLLVRAYKDTLFLIPPLSISKDEIEFLCQMTSQSITEYIKTK